MLLRQKDKKYLKQRAQHMQRPCGLRNYVSFQNEGSGPQRRWTVMVHDDTIIKGDVRLRRALWPVKICSLFAMSNGESLKSLQIGSDNHIWRYVYLHCKKQVEGVKMDAWRPIRWLLQNSSERWWWFGLELSEVDMEGNWQHSMAVEYSGILLRDSPS